MRITGQCHYFIKYNPKEIGRRDPKLPIGHEWEFRDMNQFSGIGIASLEFRVSPEVGVIA
jgi:hypothetical protein